jgi:plasmid stabilization system protein ParE
LILRDRAKNKFGMIWRVLKAPLEIIALFLRADGPAQAIAASSKIFARFLQISCAPPAIVGRRSARRSRNRTLARELIGDWRHRLG